jgi:exopolysaccharide/PEP-CTERM locus tyrosine autokinase
MSIIERALEKLQQGTSKTSADSTRASRQARLPLRRDPAPDTGRHGGRAHEAPAETIQITADHLRAGGALPAEQHQSALTDQFRRIKWPILEAVMARDSGADTRPRNRIVVTSSVAGEGKTFTSFNLAHSIAREKDFSVLLVDADVAKRHATELFKLTDRQGLTDAIADPALDPQSLVLGTSIPGLCVLPAGRRSSSAPELFASLRMVEVVEQLGDYDPQRIVLFDSSPLLATNESQVLAKIIDQIVLVVRAEFTPQPMVLEAISLLDKTKQIRCVLNQARASRMTEYYYGYGYHSNDRPQE